MAAVPGGFRPLQPTVTASPAKGDWGGIQLDRGSRDVINSAIFRYRRAGS